MDVKQWIPLLLESFQQELIKSVCTSLETSVILTCSDARNK